ncbi:hypothetical protein ACGG1M_004733, partial [Salmonella enterica]
STPLNVSTLPFNTPPTLTRVAGWGFQLLTASSLVLIKQEFAIATESYFRFFCVFQRCLLNQAEVFLTLTIKDCHKIHSHNKQSPRVGNLAPDR